MFAPFFSSLIRPSAHSRIVIAFIAGSLAAACQAQSHDDGEGESEAVEAEFDLEAWAAEGDAKDQARLAAVMAEVEREKAETAAVMAELEREKAETRDATQIRDALQKIVDASSDEE